MRTVLEGSVRKAGNRLRISAQLINIDDGYQIWSETYNRELQDVFAIQEEIAQSIAKALQVILSEKEQRAIERAPTAHVEAYEYYLRGRQYFHQFRRKGYEFALQMFAHAIGIDPAYGLAHAGTADCHSLLFMYFDSNTDNLEKADVASRKALELASDLAEAHVARGLALSLKKEYAQAAGEFQTAIRLDPKLYEARYFFGRTAWAQGDLVEAAQLFEQAFQLRADAYQAASHLAGVYVGLGRNADAQTAFRRAATVASKHLELHPDDARALYLGATLWASLGERDRALEWANRALAMDPDDAVTLYNVASVYALLREPEQALDCLENALHHGFAHKEWIEHDSDLASLRSQPRFQALLQAARYPG